MLKKIVNTLNVVVLVAGVFVPVVANAAPVLWSGDSSGRLGTVDVATGDVNVIGSMGVTMTDIAFDPDGNLWGITFGSLYKIDKTTATSTLVGNLGTSANSLVFNSSGVLYTANSSLYTIDTTTGAASLVGNGGDSYSSSGDLAFVDGNLFLSSTGGDNLVKINTNDPKKIS
jgi:sugar lactone lactonase YvrE